MQFWCCLGTFARHNTFRMTRRLLLPFLLAFAVSGMAQNQSFVLKGKVFDALTKAPVAQASIYVNETVNGTTSGSDGSYSLKIMSTPAVLVISCIGYTRRYFTFMAPQTSDFNVPLDPSLYEIPEVLVTAKRTPVSISDDQDIFVTDYDFYDNHILLLGNPGKRSTETLLVMMDRMGKRILKKEVKQGINLYRDPFNNVHLLTPDTAYQVFFDGKELSLLYPCNKERFMKSFPEFLEIYQGKIILRQYAFDDQALLYYFYNPSDTSVQRFWAEATQPIYNRIDGLVNSIPITREGKTTSQFNLFNADERFIKMAFYAPIFCPLLIIRDSIYIFNFTNGVIQTYGARGMPIDTPTAITFHTADGWQKKLFNDKVTGKVYTQFIRNGISELREINIKTGQLNEQVIKIPEFPFISKLLVNDGYLFFLYQEKQYPNFMRLYRMVI
jgi:hypothetical protein